MVEAYHVIFGTYGFWLPNDPRGSWSDDVAGQSLRQFGPATTIHTRKSVAATPHDREARIRAKSALNFPAVILNPQQIFSIGRGFQRSCEQGGVSVWECAILPDHSHPIIARHRLRIEQIVNLLKEPASRQLSEDGRHPFAEYRNPSTGRTPSPWARGCWRDFLNGKSRIDAGIRYAENNPLKSGVGPQRWPFVSPYNQESRRPEGDD